MWALRLKIQCCNFARPKFCATLRDPKQIWCDFARTKKGMLRPLGLKMGMLWLCATEILRDFARPKTDTMRLCANQKRYVAAKATQNGYVVTLRDRKICAILREPKQIWCDFARPKTDVLRLCATHKKYVATIATQDGYVETLCDRKNCAILSNLNQICCDFARPKKCILRPLPLKMGMLRLCATESFAWFCATQNRFNATLRDPKKVFCTHCDSKWVCCDFARPKNCATLRGPKQIWCDFARPKKGMLRPLRLRMGMLWLCANEKFARHCTNQNRYDATLRDPKQMCCDFARPTKSMLRILQLKMGMLWLCATKEVYCEFARPKKCMLRPLRLIMGRLRLCATENIARLCATQNIYDAFCATQNRYDAPSHDPTKL